MLGKINPMPTEQTFNRDIGLRVMWKKFSEVERGSLREREIIVHLSEWRAEQKEGKDKDTSKT